MVRGEDRGVDALRRQVGAQAGLAVGVFLGGEGGLDLVAVTDAERLGHLHGGNPCCFPVTRHTGLVGRWNPLQQKAPGVFCTNPTRSWSDPLGDSGRSERGSTSLTPTLSQRERELSVQALTVVSNDGTTGGIPVGTNSFAKGGEAAP
ncbi:hypothetical protein D9M68_842420 [compost metagenome]